MNEKTKVMITKTRLLKAASLGTMMAIALVLLTNPANAFRPIFMQFQFGMVGITRGQTARINVLNVGREPIDLSLTFTDSAGRVIKQTFETAEEGHAIFLDLTPGTVDDPAGRFQIHGSIQVYRRSAESLGRQVIPTLEVFDNETGRTHIALGACDGSV